MEPIASYADKSQFGVRSYVLYEDHVIVRYNDTLRVHGESSFSLRDLHEQYHTLAVRSSFFSAGLGLAVAGATIRWCVVELAHREPLSRIPAFFLTLSIVGVLMAVIGLRKQRLVSFHTKAGVPAFTIFREGPRKAEFDPFVAQIVAGIRAAQGAEGTC